MSFGARLKQARIAKDISQNDLAEMLQGDKKVTCKSISRYETGMSFPSPNILYQIFKILDVDPNFLFQDEYNAKDSDSQQIFNNFNSLDDISKKAVKGLIETELERVTIVKKDGG